MQTLLRRKTKVQVGVGLLQRLRTNEILTGNVHEFMHNVFVSLLMSNVLSVFRHTLEILCMHKTSGRTRRTTTYCHCIYSVTVTYEKLMPNVCNVHQRIDEMSHTSVYVGVIRLCILHSDSSRIRHSFFHCFFLAK